MSPPGWAARVLYVDLSRKRHWVEERPDLVEETLGGVGLGVRLLEEEGGASADPLSPENPVILAVGPFTFAYPMGSKTAALFRSPLTGNLGESYAGGRSAAALRLAGYSALVIRGGSESPVYLAVHGSEVRFRDASALWGMHSSVTVGRVIREREPGGGQRTIMRIGPAGERLVRYACVVTETYRHFGRLGLGAVFGAKRLKALVISGNSALDVPDRRGYISWYNRIYDSAVNSDLMEKYHDLGTAMNVLPLSSAGALPTENLRSGSFPLAGEISGERMAERYLGRRVACAGCPVACIHVAALREPYPGERYFYKTTFVSYDYEPIYALGSMLGVGDGAGLLGLIHEAESAGLDAISSGVALAWATEALERGLISERDTVVRLRWGDHRAYRRALRMIVEQPTEFYLHLAMGVEHASSVYGGGEFALALGGNEMPGYHTGPAAHLGFLIGGRHSHLDNAGYSYDQRRANLPDPERVADDLMEEEAWRTVLNSLVVCLFARKIYGPEVVSGALEPLGFDLSPDDLREMGWKTYWARMSLKARMGFDPSRLRIPKRILETPSARGRVERGFLERGLARFSLRLSEALAARGSRPRSRSRSRT